MQLEITKRRYTASQQIYLNGLIELHEANYIRLRRLLPDLEGLGESAVSTVPVGLDMHYKHLETCKYTTTFSLSYLFTEPSEQAENAIGFRAPDLQIRIYRDAQVAEVISGVLHKHYLVQEFADGKAISVDAIVRPQMDAAYARWKLNRFLYRWLGFCLRQGHMFIPPEPLQSVQEKLIDHLQSC